MHMLTWIFCLLATLSDRQAPDPADQLLAFCDFSRLAPGSFGNFAAEGFPEYHYVPREFTDGWRS